MVRLQGVRQKYHQKQICENKSTPLIPPEFTTNTKACPTSIQLSSGAKAEQINNTSRHTVGTIEVQVTRTDDTMVVLRAKETKKSAVKNILRSAVYDTAWERNSATYSRNKEIIHYGIAAK